jgi:iodotyrosine deiodinase
MLESFKKPLFKENQSVTTSSLIKDIFTYRRTIRHFSTQKPDEQIIRNAIDVARLAPSGANKQPWSFSLIKSPDLKQQIRHLAEQEEHRFYVEKPNQKWIDDLKHLHPDIQKPFLTTAPYLIVIFFKHFDRVDNQEVSTNYYAKESAGIATGMLISALHMSGLSVLTYTPKRMQFLTTLLGRPSEERPFMLLGVGLSADDAQVPTITKKALEDILTTYH